MHNRFESTQIGLVTTLPIQDHNFLQCVTNVSCGVKPVSNMTDITPTPTLRSCLKILWAPGAAEVRR
jgi:hypothetical protein